MTDLTFEPTARKHLNDLLDWLARYPRISGRIVGTTTDGRTVEIVVQSARSRYCCDCGCLKSECICQVSPTWGNRCEDCGEVSPCMCQLTGGAQ